MNNSAKSKLDKINNLQSKIRAAENRLDFLEHLCGKRQKKYHIIKLLGIESWCNDCGSGSAKIELEHKANDDELIKLIEPSIGKAELQLKSLNDELEAFLAA